ALLQQRVCETLHRRSRRMPRWWRQDLDDVAQDAFLVMLELQAAGQPVADPVGFAVTFAQRRFADQARKMARQPLEPGVVLDEITFSAPTPAPEWGAWLRRAGFEPTPAWESLLSEMASGVRGSRALAGRLGRDSSTIRERRRRLQRWLRDIASAEFPAPPPPSNDLACVVQLPERSGPCRGSVAANGPLCDLPFSKGC